jgi:hypothetical protein
MYERRVFPDKREIVVVKYGTGLWSRCCYFFC